MVTLFPYTTLVRAKAKEDRQPEINKIYNYTIIREDGPLPTTDRWAARRRMLAKLATFTDFDTLNTARVSTGATLGILRPTRIVGLDITPVDNPDWTKEELQKLVQYQQQAGLFDDDEDRKSTRLNSSH